MAYFSPTPPTEEAAFYDVYMNAVKSGGFTPFRPALSALVKDRLDLDLDVIDRHNLSIFLHILAQDSTLITVSFASHFLRDNPSLTHDLKRLHYHSEERLPVYLNPDVMSSLCNAVHRHVQKNCSRLKVLRLVGISMSESHFSQLTSVFSMASSLQTLSLEETPLPAKHVATLATALLNLRSLIILNLAQCGLNKELIAHLCHFLREDCRLQRLILNSNPLGDSGVDQVVNSLRRNHNLRALDLQNCGITSAACIPLRNLLRFNSSIEVCDIRRNSAVSRQEALVIAALIVQNNKNRQDAVSYKCLPLSTAAAITPTSESNSRTPVKIEGFLGPKSFPLVKPLPAHVEAIPPSGNSINNSRRPDGVFIPEHVLSKMEKTITKFLLFLDVLGEGQEDQSVKPRKRNSGPYEAPIAAAISGEIVHRCASPPRSESSKNPSKSESHSQSAQRTSQPSEKYPESFISSELSNSASEGILEENRQRETIDSSSLESSKRSTKKKSQPSRLKEPTIVSDDGDRGSSPGADVTIAPASHTADSAALEGITKQSSYMKIAEQIYTDPQILESTRTSEAPHDVSRRSSSSSTSFDVEKLRMRLDEIKLQYGGERPLGEKKAKPGTVRKNSRLNIAEPVLLSGISISDSWIRDAVGDSNERSLVSIPTSFSGDLTGSDLDDF